MNQIFTIKSVIASAINKLHTDEANLEAQLLLQHVLNVNRAWLIAHEKDLLQPDLLSAYMELIKRRINGEPIAYILSYREFYGIKLQVTPDTLIPRPDTETLVEAALDRIPENQTKQILDLGTGSGAIALAIAKNRPLVKLTATDASMGAINVAKVNAINLGISNIQFIHSDWFTAIENKKFDLILSNPPYIKENDAHVSKGDLRFEPVAALISGKDGLDDIRVIIKQSPQYLKPDGWLILEHGYNQAEEITALLKQTGFRRVETIKDLGGNARVTLCNCS